MRSRNCWSPASRLTAALRNALLFLAAISLSVAASAQADALQPAAADDIAGAVTDCWNAVGAKDVNRGSLQVAGWKAAHSDAQDKSVAKPLTLYGRAGRQSLIMVAERASQPMCSVIARVASPQDLGETAGTIQKALVALDPQVKATRDGNTLVFLALPKLAMADPTGSKEKPGLRIVVGYQDSEKK